MPHDPYKALYIHVPFCVSRCTYCDFHTCAIEKTSPVIEDYCERLIREIRKLSKEGELSQILSVYVGGGTPTHAGSRFLSQLFYALGVSMHLTNDVEVTLECNPESLTLELVRDVYALGVNRLSIGVQSFNDELLKVLGRAHDSQTAKRAVEIASDRFQNISIDLMCGLPHQSLEDFKQDLLTALSLPISHISIYPLSIEQGTMLYGQIMSEQLQEPDEDIAADMMEIAADILSDAGFKRYEVASYAKSGYECRHNISYWSGVPYIGVGDSAATMTQNAKRRMRITDGIVTDDLNVEQMAAEDAMLAMRMAKGLDDVRVEQLSLTLPHLPHVLKDLEDLSLVIHAEGAWRPSKIGWLCGNELYGRLFDLAP
jgi:oxygen-independent coproporphyrinogen-3 oxidase